DLNDFDDRYLEDELDRTHFFFLEGVQLTDILEVRKLCCLTKSYKHYVVLMFATKFNIGLISKRWYQEDIQDQNIQQDETVEILKAPDTFTIEVRQRVLRKNEFIDMINGFIDHKKSTINETDEMQRRGHPSQKRIKSSFETNSQNTKNSAINPSDPNLFVRQQHFQQTSSRTPLRVLNTNNIEENNNLC
ncbi:14809_t:CDS:2, partial [Funneliformis mosseae]